MGNLFEAYHHVAGGVEAGDAGALVPVDRDAAALAQLRASLLGEKDEISCPHCGSHDTEVVSQFGSTACKALYRCRSCLEPFDYFKCI